MFATVSVPLETDTVGVDDVDEFTGASADADNLFADDTWEVVDGAVGSPAATLPPTPSWVLSAGSTGGGLPPSPYTGGDTSTVSVVVGVPIPQVS